MNLNIKSIFSTIFFLTIIAFFGTSTAFAQLFYPSSQLLKIRNAKLVVTGKIIYKGQIFKTLSTHPGSVWQTVVFEINDVLKGDEKGEYVRVAFFTEKQLASFSKGDKLILVLDDKSTIGCGENVLNAKTSNQENSPAFQKYEESSCFYAYPEDAFENTEEELDTMRIFLNAVRTKN